MPRGIAMVSWSGAEHVSVEVAIGAETGARGAAVWVSRELEFVAADPEVERWRAVGFTIALLADDPRFWPEAATLAPVGAPAASPADVEPAPAGDAAAPDAAALLELRALAGAGLVSGPWRWGAELRLAVPISSIFFVTGSMGYALANEAALDVRWLDATLGIGIDTGPLFFDVAGRLRLEVIGENIAVAVERGGAVDRTGVWVPGVSVGGDLLWPVAEGWVLSTRADAFWLDGSTAIVSAGERLDAAAGAGLLLGLGAGRHF
jgi:hypothetical protein